MRVKRNVFKPAIVLVLLNNLGGGLSKYAVAKAVGCTPSWAIMVFKELERKKLVKGVRVLDFVGLLDYYRSIFNPGKPLLFSVGDTQKLFALLKDSGMDYALTTYVAENLVQKHLFVSTIDFYVREEDLDEWRSRLSGLGVAGGGNVRVFTAKPCVLYNVREARGLKLVSRPQLIVDLFNEGASAAEAAEMLLEKVKPDVR